MNQKIVVFDFGGVLFKTSVTDFYRERFQAQGRNEEELAYFLNNVLTNQDLSHSNGGNAQDLINKKILKYPQWADEIRAYGAKGDFLKTIRNIIPEMENVLSALANEGHQIVGLTNWHGDTYDLLPPAFPALLKHFNQVVVSGKIGLRKPDPEIFRQAHAAYGSPDPTQVYYFDDKPANTEAARKAVGWNAFTFKNSDTVRSALALKSPRP